MADLPARGHDEAMRKALLRADPLLSRYDPLERLLMHCDFDAGIHGWQTYFPDYDGSSDYPGRDPHFQPLDEMLAQSRTDPSMRADRRAPTGPRGVPMLSTLTSWDVGASGSFRGTYALKIPTAPLAGTHSWALRRVTSPWRGKVRFECYFTYKAEPSDFRLGELDVRSVFISVDAMDLGNVRGAAQAPVRWWPSVRYHNAQDGKLIQRWQANFSGSKGTKDGPFTDLEDGYQELGFNRSPTKYQWHYLRFTFDTARHEYVDLHCHGKEFDIAGRRHVFDPPLSGFRASTDRCAGLLNFGIGIETNSDKRCFLYLDSIVVSMEPERRIQG